MDHHSEDAKTAFVDPPIGQAYNCLARSHGAGDSAKERAHTLSFKEKPE